MVDPTTSDRKAGPRLDESKAEECPPDNKLPENTQENLDRKLDHAIEETFPTSDPVSVSVTKGGAIDYDRDDAASQASSPKEARGTAEELLHRAQETLLGVTGNAAETARESYRRAGQYVRRASERYPTAERQFREGGRAVRQLMPENPWLLLIGAGAAGYLIAWLTHGRSNRNQRLGSRAGTIREFGPSRNPRHGL